MVYFNTMKNSNLISFAVGVAILVGVAAGYTLNSKKYFFVHPLKGKSEISYDLYSNFANKEFIQAERAFNIEVALVSGALVIALALLVVGIGFNIKKKEITVTLKR